MAKKRRRVSSEPEETYEFVPPEFDEREFLLKDQYGTKVLMITALLAVIVGFVSSSLYKTFGLWQIGIILIFLIIIGFKQFFTLLRFRVDLMDNKMMFGNYILFFFLSLGVWIIFLNPPFA
ncbi:MAG: hypothetical protein FWD92_02980 [Methanomassiliicoccaceae archaeon]|nr:hypothetical protein [Methanomassiliicoccaceae archaeon]